MSSNGWRGPGWRIFAAHPGQVGAARAWISGVVGAHGCQVDPTDAALAVSELFTNAVIHGPRRGRVLVGYCLWPGGARIVVCDGGGATTPRPRDPASLAEGGRGLRVIDAIAARWDSFRTAHHQVVWCDLGQPLQAGSADVWAWLSCALAIPLAPPVRSGGLARARASSHAADVAPAITTAVPRRPSHGHQFSR